MGIIQRQNYFKGQEMQNVPPWREKMQNRTDLSEQLLDFAAATGFEGITRVIILA